MSDCDGDTLHLALVQYCFDDKEHSVIPRPHANSEQSERFVCTMPSTLQKLQDISTNLTAKFAVCIGEYRLTSEYQNLATDARKFIQMS